MLPAMSEPSERIVVTASDERRRRFPGIGDGWARFDGPAGTQMVDRAIDAAATWSASGNTANCGGLFAAAAACDELLRPHRGARSGGCSAPIPPASCFGANMTTLTFAFTRAVGRRRCGRATAWSARRLDHDANVTPWRLAADRAGAEHVLAPFDPATGRARSAAVVELIDERTSWVAVTGASNLHRHTVDLAPIVAAAHAVGARVFVDAVHLAPHRRIDVAALGCDVLVTSPYKWYGPHAGVLCGEPALLDALPVAKVRPARRHRTRAVGRPGRRTSRRSPPIEAAAAVPARARASIGSPPTRRASCATLLDGLGAIGGVRLWGPPTMDGRVPTVAFTVDGRRPDDVAAAARGREGRGVERAQRGGRDRRPTRARRHGWRRARRRRRLHRRTTTSSACSPRCAHLRADADQATAASMRASTSVVEVSRGRRGRRSSRRPGSAGWPR